MRTNASEKTKIKRMIYQKQGIKAQGYWQDKEAEQLITEYMKKRSQEELDKGARV